MPEDVGKLRGENLVHTTEKINDVLNTIDIQPQIVEVNILWKYSKNVRKLEHFWLPYQQKTKPQSSRQKTWKIKTKLWTKLLNDGVPGEKSRIRNVELFNNNVKVDLESNRSVDPEASLWLHHMDVLLKNAQNLVNYERHFLLQITSNAISLCQAAVIRNC